MRNIKLMISVICAIFTVTSWSQIPEKVVWFTHGMNGAESTWATPRQWTFDNFKCQTPEFHFDNSLPTNDEISDQVYEIYKAYYDNHPEINGTQSIVIGHSQGGPTAANINRKDDEANRQRSFGALATFSSPMEGAPVFDNFDCLENIIADFCRTLQSVSVVEILHLLITKPDVREFLKLFFGKDQLNRIDFNTGPVNLDCDNLAQDARELLRSSITTPSAERDLRPGSQFIQNLKNHTMDVPGLAVIGTEDDPVSLRVAYSSKHDVNFPTQDQDNPNPPDSDNFTADFDEGYIEAFDKVADAVDAEADLLEAVSKLKIARPSNVPKSAFCFTCETLMDGSCDADQNVCSLYCAKLANEAAAVRNLLREFVNLDQRYRHCYGFDQTTETTFYRTVCKCYKDVGPTRIEIDPYPGPCDPSRLTGFTCNEEQEEAKTITTTRGGSDGAVPAASQAAIHTNEYYSFPADGSNHFQIKNDHNAGQVFPDMYEGNTYGFKFKLERR